MQRRELCLGQQSNVGRLARHASASGPWKMANLLPSPSGATRTSWAWCSGAADVRGWSPTVERRPAPPLAGERSGRTSHTLSIFCPLGITSERCYPGKNFTFKTKGNPGPHPRSRAPAGRLATPTSLNRPPSTVRGRGSRGQPSSCGWRA